MIRRIALALVAIAVSSAPAFAHLNPAEHGSFASGMSHPLFGVDHILAMVAVGLWAALIGGRALWAAPLAFVGAMGLGFLACMLGLALPFVEPVILASVIVLGLVVALAMPVPIWLCAGVIGFFAFFHGHAHGGEIGAAGMLPYAAGFAVATAMLHATGIAIGLGLGRLFGGNTGRIVTRTAGAATALGGLWLAMGV